ARRRRRGIVAAVGGVTMFVVLPTSVLQVILYRQNLAMARERFPVGPTLTSRDRLLILAPHCDDETLGAGGTIAAARAVGAAVRVAFLTNGDGSRSTRIVEDARRPADFLLRRNTFQRLALMRQQEALAALYELGVPATDVLFLGYPDGGTQTMWESNWQPDNLYYSAYTSADHSPYANSRTLRAAYCGSQVLTDVKSLIAEWQPTVIFTTHPSDTHPDHWAAYAYSAAALESLRLEPRTEEWARRVRLLTFLVHHGVWPVPHGYHPQASLSPPAALKDIGTHWMQVPVHKPARVAKRAALERYVSQLSFTPHYLRSFLRRNELFGVVPAVEGGRACPERSEGMKDESGIQIHPSSPIPHPSSLTLIQDPTRDSLLHDVWPAADWKSVSLAAPSTSGMLALRIRLGKAPSRRLHYELALHAITGSTTRAERIQVRWRDSSWGAVLDETARELPLSLTNDGFEVTLPRQDLELPASPYALLVSGSTYLGNSRLDQTATGTLRRSESTKVMSAAKW
ncbi:MAG: PIG-L family deacetylase, partial [Armatimonadota bacterium]|nr:PIG-L family deacetylase [Armatimonadota bacterium]